MAIYCFPHAAIAPILYNFQFPHSMAPPNSPNPPFSSSPLSIPIASPLPGMVEGELFLHLCPSGPSQLRQNQLVGTVISDRSLNAPTVIRILTNAWAELGHFNMEILPGTTI